MLKGLYTRRQENRKNGCVQDYLWGDLKYEYKQYSVH